MSWRDVTSHSQGETPTQRDVVRTTELSLGGFRVTVTRHRSYDPGAWVLSTAPAFITLHQLEATGLDEAQNEALQLLQDKLVDVLTDLRAAMKSMKGRK